MTDVLTRDAIVDGWRTEFRNFRGLVIETAAFWSKPTRCLDMTVSAVASHVVGTTADIVSGQLTEQGTPATIARQVAERAGHTANEVAAEINELLPPALALLAFFDDDAWEQPAPGDFSGPLRQAVHALWFDMFLHADDIRDAAHLPSDRGLALEASLEFVTDRLAAGGVPDVTIELASPEIAIVTRDRHATRVEPFALLRAAKGRIPGEHVGLGPWINVNWVPSEA